MVWHVCPVNEGDLRDVVNPDKPTASLVSHWTRPALRLVVPLAAAFVVIHLETPFAALAQRRPAVLPITMVALVAGLLSPYIRRWLIVTLCFGISLLAWHDTFRDVPLPLEMSYPLVESIYPFLWGLLAVLAFVAGAAEALRPGSVWARRCYFAAASVYFSGHGLMAFLKQHDWQSIVLLVTGVISLVGAITAPRVVASESAPDPLDDDLRTLAEEREQRAARLAAREWREAHDVCPKGR